MTDELDTGDAEQRRPPPQHPCKQCGGITAPQALLDSRQGKNYRLVRCLGCEKLDWAEV